MPSTELQALAVRLGRPAQSLEALDCLPAESLTQLIKAIEANQQIERQRLEAAFTKALPAVFWRIAMLGVTRDSA